MMEVDKDWLELVSKFWLKLPLQPQCMGCLKYPSQLSCYTDCAAEMGVDSDEYVRREEGTYNSRNGHFLCDDCYIEAGMPTSPWGWTCP